MDFFKILVALPFKQTVLEHSWYKPRASERLTKISSLNFESYLIDIEIFFARWCRQELKSEIPHRTWPPRTNWPIKQALAAIRICTEPRTTRSRRRSASLVRPVSWISFRLVAPASLASFMNNFSHAFTCCARAASSPATLSFFSLRFFHLAPSFSLSPRHSISRAPFVHS